MVSIERRRVERGRRIARARAPAELVQGSCFEFGARSGLICTSFATNLGRPLITWAAGDACAANGPEQEVREAFFRVCLAALWPTFKSKASRLYLPQMRANVALYVLERVVVLCAAGPHAAEYCASLLQIVAFIRREFRGW